MQHITTKDEVKRLTNGLCEWYLFDSCLEDDCSEYTYDVSLELFNDEDVEIVIV